MKINKSIRMFFSALLMKAGTMATDKATLIFDGEEIAEGIDVFVESVDEEGNVEYIVPEDGEYVAEDGRKITVEGGKIAKIEEAEAEVEETTEEVVEEMAEENVEEPATEPAEEVEETTEEVSEEAKMLAEIAQKLEGMLSTISALETRVSALEEKVNALDSTPAAEPEVEEQMEHSEQKKSKLSLRRK